MPNNTSIPVSRNSIWYSNVDYDYETSLVMGYFEEDLNQTVVVYQVDRVRTNTNSIYQDAKDKVQFKTPVEIPCMYEVEDSTLQSYDKKTSNGAYVVTGGITVYTMPLILDKYECDVKRGDYLGLLIEPNRMIYFVVTDDGKVNTSNKHIIGAYKTAYRVIKGAPVTDLEFNGE